MNIGAKVRSLRKSRGLTLAQVAKGLGMTAAGLSLIERGERRITVEQLERIAQILGKSPRYFFEQRLDAASSNEGTA